MNGTIETAIRDTVTKYVNDGFMFTAFDVTRAVRLALGKGTYVSHSEVNGIVQTMFNNSEMGSHVRDLVSVGTGTQPWLYYNPACDLSDYDPHWISNDPKQANMKADVTGTVNSTGYTPPALDDEDDEDEDDYKNDVAVPSGCGSVAAHMTGTYSHPSIPVSSVTTSKKRLGKNEHVATKDGRLNIPIHMVSAAGLAPLMPVTIVCCGTGLTIISGSTPAFNTVVSSVNKDGRIRVGYKSLRQISSQPLMEIYKVERSNSEIIIEKV